MITLNPTEKKAVASAVQEMSDSMLRIEAEKELMKDIVDVTFEKYGVDKKYFRKIANIYHKQNLVDVRSENEELMDLYEELFK